MSSTILQWNIRGIKANLNELRILNQTYNFAAVCLQETKLVDPEDTLSIKGYTPHHVTSVGPAGGPAGGVTILVRRGILASKVRLNTNLQAVAVRVTLNKPITLCSLYIPPHQIISRETLQDLVEQLPSPFLLLGDFNAHNPIWGSSFTNNRGNIVERVLDDNDLCLLNNDEPTYVCPRSGSRSTIDISIAHPDCFEDLSWRPDHDLHGSDHFPIIIEESGESARPRKPKWKLGGADWPLYRALCSDRFKVVDFVNEENPVDKFTDILVEIGDAAIPKTSGKLRPNQNPWFDDDCREAIKQRKHAQRKMVRSPTGDNIGNFRKIRAATRRTINTAKRESWRQYVSKITPETPSKKVWDMIRKMKGKSSADIKHIHDNGEVLVDSKEIADKFAETFRDISSSANYSPQFRQHANNAEKVKLNFSSDNTETYNKLFCMDELRSVLSDVKEKAYGPDHIPYTFLKNLPKEGLQSILDVFNNVWCNGKFPDIWRNGHTIPIPKPGKDHTNPVNYRPITLTSCVCKVMEKVVNQRLVWYLESKGLLTNKQSGFRKQRSTIYNLVKL